MYWCDIPQAKTLGESGPTECFQGDQSLLCDVQAKARELTCVIPTKNRPLRYVLFVKYSKSTVCMHFLIHYRAPLIGGPQVA